MQDVHNEFIRMQETKICVCVCAHIHVYQIHPTTIIANCLKGVNVFLLVDVE